jgi:hypothetical protein
MRVTDGSATPHYRVPSSAKALGALVSRFGWIAVGKISGCDPEAVFASQK